MKQLAFLSFAFFLSGSALAQTTPESITDTQIDMYKGGVEAGCRNRGREVGDAPERVDAFCDCMMRMLSAEVSKADWQRAIAHSLDKREQEEWAVFQPYLARLAACKAKPPA